MKLEAFDSGYFRGKSHFEDDDIQNYLVSQPVSRFFETVANIIKVTACKSKEFSYKSIKPPSASDNSLNSGTNYFYNSRKGVKLLDILKAFDKVWHKGIISKLKTKWY